MNERRDNENKGTCAEHSKPLAKLKYRKSCSKKVAAKKDRSQAEEQIAEDYAVRKGGHKNAQ